MPLPISSLAHPTGPTNGTTWRGTFGLQRIRVCRPIGVSHRKDTPDFDTELRTVLGRTYNLKAIADYETSPGSKVSPESATDAMGTAGRFVARMVKLIEGR
jgi:hypothetical protein